MVQIHSPRPMLPGTSNLWNISSWYKARSSRTDQDGKRESCASPKLCEDFGSTFNNRNSLILQSLMIFGGDSPLGYFRAFLQRALKHADSMAQSQVFQAGGQPRERLSERKRTRSATREAGIE